MGKFDWMQLYASTYEIKEFDCNKCALGERVWIDDIRFKIKCPYEQYQDCDSCPYYEKK